MQLHPFSVTDLPLLTSLQPEGWPDIVSAFIFYEASPFCFPIKITLAGELVGIGTTIVHHDVAWLAHIIVHADYRNRGIGTCITQSLIKSIDSRVCKTIYLIATEAGAPVYEKSGFETETEYLFYKDVALSNNSCLSPHIHIYHTRYKEQVGYIDRIISGEERMFHLDQYLSGAYVYVSNGQVEGYFLPDLHEGPIVAATSKAGIELMYQRLLTRQNASFPINNTEALACMTIQGFEPFKIAKRMRLGEIRPVAYAKIFNRIAGSIG